ncbi:hypothetical protein ACWN8P_12665 [Vagococcus salmoninarum]|uniref:DNA-binding protein n=1 Tax=Vagococcus salmoninarum TaxID=2739 RepID=A0A429ZSA8_9ENTE|nr:hypothetical protein [Vagococcus salmoninarum]RST96630.1 hypothetical protein CBF35_05200 [Vagococcus salmoninarum]
MQITIPDNVIEKELAEKLVFIVLKEVDSRLKLLNQTVELPPYPNKSQVKEVLGIGDDKLSDWLARGLKCQIWSKQDIRIERGELQEFLKKMEVKEV